MDRRTSRVVPTKVPPAQRTAVPEKGNAHYLVRQEGLGGEPDAVEMPRPRSTQAKKGDCHKFNKSERMVRSVHNYCGDKSVVSYK